MPHLPDEGPLRVRDEEAGIELHEVRLHVVARLTRPRSAHDHDVEVAVGLDVEPPPVEGEAGLAREDDVVVGVLGIAERPHLRPRRPARASVLLARAPRPGAHEPI